MMTFLPWSSKEEFIAIFATIRSRTKQIDYQLYIRPKTPNKYQVTSRKLIIKQYLYLIF